MECARCGQAFEAPAFPDGEAAVLDSVMEPADEELGLPLRALKFRLFRAAHGNHEVARLELCGPCAARLARAVWMFVDGNLAIILPGDREHSEPGGVM